MEFELSDIYFEIQNRNEDTPSEILKLISNEEDINLKSETGQTFLHLISECYSGDVDAPLLIPIVFQLSNAGIDKNVRDDDGKTALHVASVGFGSFQLVRALIIVGVDPNILDNNGKTALDIATDPVVRATINSLQPGLWKAIEDGNDEATLRLVGSWCKINDTRKGKSMIDFASLVCETETVKILEANLCTNNFIHYAFAKDNRNMRKVIKRPGVDVNTRNITHICINGETFEMPLLGELAFLQLVRPVKKILEHGADVNVRVDETSTTSDPLYLHLMKNLPGMDGAYDVLELVLQNADISLIKNPSSIFTVAFEKRFPSTIIKLLQAKGVNLFVREENGYTLRDQIYLENFATDDVTMRHRLAFVDELVIRFASEGDVNFLESLALNSYDCDDIVNTHGKSLVDILLERGVQNSLSFVVNLPQLQKTIRRLHQSVANGNLKDVKELMNISLSTSRDKGGRSLLHKAVLFERRFIIKYLLQQYPQTVNVKDTGGRTPLHWAVCLNEGKDIEDALIIAGARPNTPDKNGKTPEDYRTIAPEILKIIEKERLRDYGIDVYLLQKYMKLKTAITDGNLPKVEEIRNLLYRDISLSDIHKYMYPVEPPQRDLLTYCVDIAEDKIGKYLLSQGLEWDKMYEDKDTGKRSTIYDAAKQRQMTRVVEYIDYQRSRKEESAKTAKLLVEKNDVILRDKPSNKTNNDINDQKGSCSCGIL